MKLIRWRSRSKVQRRALWGGAIAALALTAGSIAVAQSVEGQVELPAATRAAGESCSDWPEGQACASGLCLDVTPFGSVCSQVCTSDADCTLEDFFCHFIREPKGTVIGLCTPLRIGAGR